VGGSFWLALVSLLVAIGGLAVAVLGYRANAEAIRREQADRKQQIEDEWTREWAAQRPLVYPLALRDWAYASEGTRYRLGNSGVLPLKNAGRGPALNVHGRVTTRAPDGTTYACDLAPASIAAGELLDGRLIPQPGIKHWLGASGLIEYADLAGTQYETRFDFPEGPHGEITVDVHPQVVVSRS
jgi:hypothetical protein